MIGEDDSAAQLPSTAIGEQLSRKNPPGNER
jgi:hypothetical protein